VMRLSGGGQPAIFIVFNLELQTVEVSEMILTICTILRFEPCAASQKKI
jgi:hypothetical protein